MHNVLYIQIKMGDPTVLFYTTMISFNKCLVAADRGAMRRAAYTERLMRNFH